MRDGIIKKFCLLGGGLFLLGFAYGIYTDFTQAATITTGYTFSAGETNITHTKLNQAVNGATLSGISTADINSSAVTGSKIAANTIPGSKLQTNAVSGGVGGQINSNTVTSYNIKTGTLNGTEFSNVVTFASGTYNYTNSVTLNYSTDQIASAAIAGTNGASGTLANGVVKLNSAGIINNRLIYQTTNAQNVISATVDVGTGYSTLASYTTTATNGTVLLFGIAQVDGTTTGAGVDGADIFDGTTTLHAVACRVGSGDILSWPIPVMAKDTLTGTAKTYSLRGVCSGGAGASRKWFKTGASANSSAVGITNGCQLIGIEFPNGGP